MYATPSLTAEDSRVLEEIEAARHALRHQVGATPAKRTAGLRKFLTADAVAASNSIEGFKVSTIDVEDLMEGERDVDVSEENREETLAYQRMMTYIQTLHDVEDFRYSAGFLNALHWMLQGHRHTMRKPGGQWRKGPVYVTDARDPSIAAYTAPEAPAVQGHPRRPGQVRGAWIVHAHDPLPHKPAAASLYKWPGKRIYRISPSWGGADTQKPRSPLHDLGFAGVRRQGLEPRTR
ncbi:hypothetical protein [Nonomuraea sp. NPDC049784]|uniref:hypothetical protein n=1 Tax=Nonomuraea sp. NPDC049784 TaxID=3154361 RepID=UPI00340D9081